MAMMVYCELCKSTKVVLRSDESHILLECQHVYPAYADPYWQDTYVRLDNGILAIGPDWDAEIESGYQKLEEAARQTEREEVAALKAWQRYCETGAD